MLNLVMLVDEDDIDLLINERIIKKAGFADRIIKFDSSQSALDYLKEQANTPENIPELAFLDINMPIMNGFDFMDAYQSYPLKVQEKCKIIMLSSTIHPDDVKKAEAYPQCLKYMNKPLGKAVLEVLLPEVQALKGN